MQRINFNNFINFGQFFFYKNRKSRYVRPYMNIQTVSGVQDKHVTHFFTKFSMSLSILGQLKLDQPNDFLLEISTLIKIIDFP